jgi:hypothetical protein
MGFLDSFERQVERLVGGAFAKTFTSGVHPIEIVAALKKELDASARTLSRDRVVAPHQLRVGLAEVDLSRLGSLGQEFVDEIIHAVREYGSTRNYFFSDQVEVVLEQQNNLSEGMVEVRSAPVGKVVWVPTILWKDVRYPITRATTVIGRGTDTDVHVVHTGVSRHHAEIRWNGKRAEVVDLGSTNGTKLDGVKVSRAALPDSCILGVGQARILFEVVPMPEARYHAIAHTPDVVAKETS